MRQEKDTNRGKKELPDEELDPPRSLTALLIACYRIVFYRGHQIILSVFTNLAGATRF